MHDCASPNTLTPTARINFVISTPEDQASAHLCNRLGPLLINHQASNAGLRQPNQRCLADCSRTASLVGTLSSRGGRRALQQVGMAAEPRQPFVTSAATPQRGTAAVSGGEPLTGRVLFVVPPSSLVPGWQWGS